MSRAVFKDRVGLCKLDIRGVSPLRDISHKIKDFGESSQKFLIFQQSQTLQLKYGSRKMQFYVKDIMSTELVTVSKNDTIRDLVNIFSDNALYGVPVINDDGYVAGVVSISDVIKNESSHNFYYAPFIQNVETSVLENVKFFNQKVSGIMTKDLYTISPDDTVAKMAKEMYDKKIHRLLVTDYEKLIGIVSTFDVLKLLATSDEEVIV